MSAAKQAFYEVRGAKAEISMVREIGDRALQHYESVRFEPATTDVGPVCPTKVLSAWDRNAEKEQQRLAEHFASGSPALRVESELYFFKGKSILGAAECLARVRMFDDDELQADMVVQSSSKAFSAGGEDALTEAAVKKIGKFLLKQKGVEADDEKEKEKREKDNDKKD